MKRLKIDTNLFATPFIIIWQNSSGVVAAVVICVLLKVIFFFLFVCLALLLYFHPTAQMQSGCQVLTLESKKHTVELRVLMCCHQPMLQCRPYCMEVRSMDSFIQILCRFQKCKQIAPQLWLLNNEKSRNAKLGFKDLQILKISKKGGKIFGLFQDFTLKSAHTICDSPII